MVVSLSRQPELFISFSSQDRAKVLAIVEQLERADICAWIDQRGIAVGEAYGSVIAFAIQSCQAVAVMCSNASLRSWHVKQEILLACKHRKPYLPLLLEPVSYPEQLEYWLEGHQWLEVGEHPPERWLPQIVQAVQRLRAKSGDTGIPEAAEGTSATYRGMGAAQPTAVSSPNSLEIYPAQGLAGLRAAARFTDQIWPIPAERIRPRREPVFRGMGAPQDHVQHRFAIGSHVGLVIEAERAGYLTLLDEGPEGILYCLCPSDFAPDARLPAGRSYLPQTASPYDAFLLTGQPGREHLLALITQEPLTTAWLPNNPQMPARVLTPADVEWLVRQQSLVDC